MIAILYIMDVEHRLCTRASDAPSPNCHNQIPLQTLPPCSPGSQHLPPIEGTFQHAGLLELSLGTLFFIQAALLEGFLVLHCSSLPELFGCLTVIVILSPPLSWALTALGLEGSRHP